MFNPRYHAQANPTERVNRTLKTMLSMYIDKNQRYWDKNLQRVTCAIRTSCHEVTGHSPYFINFGREIILNGTDFSFRHTCVDEKEGDPDIRNKHFKNLYKEIATKIKTYSDKNKAHYDLRRRPKEFKVGDRVWRKNYSLSDKAKHYNSKLAPRYVGPFSIYKKISLIPYKFC